MRFPIPAILYGTLGNAGRGWKKIARIAWDKGWDAALANVEYVDLLETPGVIVTQDKPKANLTPQYKDHPFFGIYDIHDAMTDLAHGARKHAADCMRVYIRLRDLILHGLEWPWYALGTLWPDQSFIPPYDNCFPTFEEWQEEEKRVARLALQKIVRHFELFAQIESRIAPEGLFGMHFLPPGKLRIYGVFRHCMVLGMEEKMLRDLLGLAPTKAERALLAWVKENGVDVDK